VPLPCPLADVVKLIQSTGVDTDHEHSRSIEIDSEPVPPAGAKLVG